MLNTPINTIKLGDLISLLGAYGISCAPYDNSYSELIPRVGHNKIPTWLILVKNSPIQTIGYTGRYVRCQCLLRKNITGANIRTLKLRKLFPNHRVKTSITESKNTFIDVRIDHLEPVSALVDSVKAVEHLFEIFDN